MPAATVLIPMKGHSLTRRETAGMGYPLSRCPLHGGGTGALSHPAELSPLSSQQPWGVAQACLAAEEAAGVTK